MTYRGQVEGGVIVLEEATQLPEGTKVSIEPLAPGGMTLAEEFKDFIGKGTDLPEDLAENHDHYLYGTPKR